LSSSSKWHFLFLRFLGLASRQLKFSLLKKVATIEPLLIGAKLVSSQDIHLLCWKPLAQLIPFYRGVFLNFLRIFLWINLNFELKQLLMAIKPRKPQICFFEPVGGISMMALILDR